MKKTKRLLALVLAMMMAFTTLVLPAAAHGGEDEGIMPLYEVIKCPTCGNNAIAREEPKYYYDSAYAVNSCADYRNIRHTHVPYQNVKITECTQCAFRTSDTLPTMYYQCVLNSSRSNSLVTGLIH